jgi:tetratricopeptide (TPR) repeat protein
MLPLFLILLFALFPRPRSVDQRLEQAWRAMQNGSPLAVAENVVEALGYLPGRLELWEVAGRYALAGGDVEHAITWFELASTEGSLTSQGQLALGEAYWQNGDLNRAAQVWQALSPSPEAYTHLAQAHRALGDYEAAIDDLESLLTLGPGNADTHYQLGLLYAATHPEVAMAHLERAAGLNTLLAPAVEMLQRSLGISLFENDPSYTYLQTGRSLASLDEWDLAVEAFRRAAKARPDYAEAHAYLGEALQHLTSPPLDARSELEKALSLDLNSVAANVFMGIYWQRLEEYEKSLEYLEIAASLEPDNPALQAEIANTYAAKGDLPTALSFYQKSVELAPRDPVYWRVLAEFSLQHQVQVRQIALPAIRQALLLSPDDPVILDLMGHTFFLLEDYSSAERFLLRAVQADPAYAQARLHLGMTYLLQGEISVAREQLSLAHDLAPQTQVAERAQRLLQRYFP